MYLLGMLKAAGFDASPVILSTRDHGKVKTNYPFVDFFNYMIPIINIDGNIIDAYPADENTLHYFTDAKARINAHREGLILLHGIIPDFTSKEEKAKKVITPLAWQLLKEGKHPTFQGARQHE